MVLGWSRQAFICGARLELGPSYTCFESRGTLFHTPYYPPAAPGH